MAGLKPCATQASETDKGRYSCWLFFEEMRSMRSLQSSSFTGATVRTDHAALKVRAHQNGEFVTKRSRQREWVTELLRAAARCSSATAHPQHPGGHGSSAEAGQRRTSSSSARAPDSDRNADEPSCSRAISAGSRGRGDWGASSSTGATDHVPGG